MIWGRLLIGATLRCEACGLLHYRLPVAGAPGGAAVVSWARLLDLLAATK